MAKNELAAIVLAAGLSTRMKSKATKVLCQIKGKSMVLRSVGVAVDIAGANTIVVVGHQAEDVKKNVSEVFNVKFAYQKEQLGTGHAVLCAIPFLTDEVQDIVILCGDVPLLTSNTVCSLVCYHKLNGNGISVLAVNTPNPEGYGRISLGRDGIVKRIIEETDANRKEKKNTLVNTGIFCVKHSCLETTLRGVKRDNAKKEIYLTDIIKVGYELGLKLGVHVSNNAIEAIGVNTLEELVRAEILSDTNID